MQHYCIKINKPLAYRFTFAIFFGGLGKENLHPPDFFINRLKNWTHVWFW